MSAKEEEAAEASFVSAKEEEKESAEEVPEGEAAPLTADDVDVVEEDDAPLRASTVAPIGEPSSGAVEAAAAVVDNAVDDDSDDGAPLPTSTPAGELPAGFKVYGNPASPDYEEVQAHAPVFSPPTHPVAADDDSDDAPEDGPRHGLVSMEEAAAKQQIAIPQHSQEQAKADLAEDANSKLVELFARLDSSGTGEVGRRQLVLALRRDGALAELLNLPQHIFQEGTSRDAFEAAFLALDDDGSGTISLQEMINHFGVAVDTAATTAVEGGFVEGTLGLEDADQVPRIAEVSNADAVANAEKRKRLDDPTANQYQPPEVVHMTEAANPSALGRSMTSPPNIAPEHMVDVPIGGDAAMHGAGMAPAMSVKAESRASSMADTMLSIASQLPPIIAVFEIMAALTAFAVAADCNNSTLQYAAVWAAFALLVHAGALVQINKFVGIESLRPQIGPDWLFGRPRWASSPITTAMFLSFSVLFAAGWMLEGLALWSDEDICGKNTSSQAYLGLLSVAYVMLALLLISHALAYLSSSSKVGNATALLADVLRMHAHRATRVGDTEACVIATDSQSKVLCLNGVELALFGTCDRTGQAAILPLGTAVIEPAHRSLLFDVMESGRSLPPKYPPARRGPSAYEAPSGPAPYEHPADAQDAV